MKAVKVTLWMVTISLCIFVLITYHLYHFSFTRNHYDLNKLAQQLPSSTKRNYDTPMRHIPFDEIYKDVANHDQDFSIEFEESRQAQMINTPGCRIPVAMVDYKESMKRKKRASCGNRAVFLKLIDTDQVRVEIKQRAINKYLKKGTYSHCCYRFFRRSTVPGYEHKSLWYSNCKSVRDKDIILLQHDFINVQCFENTAENKTHRIYDDVFAFCKKINVTSATRCGEKYNVLLLGMDSMSLSRFVQTMPRTLSFLQNKFWPSYRGYHKIGDNTFPNLMAALTGQSSSTIAKSCSRRMDDCKDKFIWNHFKNSGYVTAYGEDYLQLPDIFSKDYIFRKPPTDHYMRHFFLKGEIETNLRSLLCSGKISSGQQLLDYAMNFVLTYRNDPFFGFFWMNSFSHNMENHPADADIFFENFFNRLSYTGVFDNTFVIFLSDHGIRFGKHRLQVESYYDDRLPLLYIWPPRTFKINYPSKLKAVLINQFRLVTPYDIFDTLFDINDLSNCDLKERSYSDFKHQSILSVMSPNRTCQDAGIQDKWCSCHKLYPIDVDDTEGIRSVQFTVSHIQTVIKSIKTKRCWTCTSLSFKNVSRIHFFYDNDKVNLYFVVAFSMSPKNIFYEATVMHRDTQMELVGSINIISAYRGFGQCTIRREDRIFCVCQRITNCRINPTP